MAMADNKLCFTTDELSKMYNEAISKGIEHSEPSPSTIKMFKNMEEKIKNIEIKMAVQEEKMSNVCNDVSDIKNSLNTFIEKADTKYVYRDRVYRLEGVVYKTIFLAISSVLGILGQIIWFLINRFT